MEDKKIKIVKEWKTSTKIKSFLEFVNFYRWFIKKFSYAAKLLNKLKDKNKQK